MKFENINEWIDGLFEDTRNMKVSAFAQAKNRELMKKNKKPETAFEKEVRYLKSQVSQLKTAKTSELKREISESMGKLNKCRTTSDPAKCIRFLSQWIAAVKSELRKRKDK